MLTVNKVFDLDITSPSPQAYIHAYQGDTGTRRVLFTLWDSERPFDHRGATVATLYALKPDGTRVMDACTLTEDGVEVTISAGMSAVAGKVRCQIELACEGKVIACPEFILNVIGRVCAPSYEALTECPDDWEESYTAYYTASGGVYLPVEGQSAPEWEAGVYYALADGAIESSDEFGALTAALLQARSALDEAGALRDAAADGAFDGEDGEDGADGASVYVAFTADGQTMTETATTDSRWVGFAQSSEGRPESIEDYQWVDLKMQSGGTGGLAVADGQLTQDGEAVSQLAVGSTLIAHDRIQTPTLVLPNAPASDYEAANKAYVDGLVGDIEALLGGI